MPLKNDVKDVKAQCQILWFQWKNNIPTGNVSELSDSTAFDISNHLIDFCTFSKNMGSPAGGFTFRLDNSRDWKDIMKPGQWCLIFMSNEGDLILPQNKNGGKSKKGPRAAKASKVTGTGQGTADLPIADRTTLRRNRLRGMCYIERVSTNVVMTGKGVLDVVYEVSGRDFGVVYEQTDIWFNYFKFEQTLVSGLAERLRLESQNSIRELVETTHSLFFAPEAVIKSKRNKAVELTEIGTQWLLPRTMLSMMGIEFDRGESFYGNIRDITETFSDTLCKIPLTNPLDYINGNAWEKLKEFSISELHELFPELNADGQPRLVFRPIPWGINGSGYPRISGQLRNKRFPLFYLDLANEDNIVIPAIDVEEFTVGEDNHNRYNHFFVTSKTSFNLPQSNISVLENVPSVVGRRYPLLQKGSTRRHGFRPMHIDVNTFGFAAEGKGGDNKNGEVNPKLLVEYNELVLDYWNNAIFFETGDAKILGRNDIKIGKAIEFGDDVPYNANKIFYVEEYIDEFIIEPNGSTYWSQTLQLSRGIERGDLEDIKRAAETGSGRTRSLAKRNENFTDTGDYSED